MNAENLAIVDRLVNDLDRMRRDIEVMTIELGGLLDDMSHAIGSVRDVRQLKLEEVA